MFESKLNMYYIQKSGERKVCWLVTEIIWQIGQINTVVKLSCEFVDDQTQNILHPCESVYQYLSIDIRYIDIAQTWLFCGQ